MFKNPVIVVILIQTFLLGLVYQSYVYYVPLYLQNARQFSIMTSALIFCPTVGIQSVSGILAGYWIARYKRYGIVIKCGFGLWLLFVLPSRMNWGRLANISQRRWTHSHIRPTNEPRCNRRTSNHSWHRRRISVTANLGCPPSPFPKIETGCYHIQPKL